MKPPRIGPRLNLLNSVPISITCPKPPGRSQTINPRQSSPPPSRMKVCTTSVQTTASMPPNTVYKLTTTPPTMMIHRIGIPSIPSIGIDTR